MVRRAGRGFAAARALVAAGSASAQPAPEPQGPALVLPKIVPECRQGDGAEVVVCGRRRRSPYRLPEPPAVFDPDGGADSVSRERNALFDHGETGIGSCSNSGPGGPFGCTFKRWKHDQQQRQGHRDQRRLIQKFRDREEPEPLPGK